MTSKSILLFFVLLFSCNRFDNTQFELLVRNDSDIDRVYETVSIDISELGVDDLLGIPDYEVIDLDTGKKIISQRIDNDGNGKMDEIIFQPNVKSHTQKKYHFKIKKTPTKTQKPIQYCYGRFVPERIDDYAWENDRVAFRIYGPTAQKMIEQGNPNGTLSSGVDAWLKRVSYPVIDKWYAETTSGEGSYHEDTGEGLDNFHVGISRGVGGLAVYKNGTYYYSKNYNAYRIITTGPLRTAVKIDYENWDASGSLIKESKIISLDYGSYLSRFDTYISGSEKISVGLTMHEKDGVVSADPQKSWMSYWQPHADSELGTGIVVSPDRYLKHSTYDVTEKDLSNAYLQMKVIKGEVVYYAGFGWKKQGVFKSQRAWEDYLSRYADCLKNPLKLEIIK